MQQYVEAPVSQFLSELAGSLTTFRFVIDDEFDIRNIAHQSGFKLADNPGDACLRPLGLQGAHDRQRMADIANG